MKMYSGYWIDFCLSLDWWSWLLVGQWDEDLFCWMGFCFRLRWWLWLLVKQGDGDLSSILSMFLFRLCWWPTHMRVVDNNKMKMYLGYWIDFCLSIDWWSRLLVGQWNEDLFCWMGFCFRPRWWSWLLVKQWDGDLSSILNMFLSSYLLMTHVDDQRAWGLLMKHKWRCIWDTG